MTETDDNWNDAETLMMAEAKIERLEADINHLRAALSQAMLLASIPDDVETFIKAVQASGLHR